MSDVEVAMLGRVLGWILGGYLFIYLPYKFFTKSKGADSE